MMSDSIFTKIIKGEIPCYKIAEDDRFIAFLDVFPIKKGHTLVVPKAQIDYIFDLDDPLLSDLMLFAKKVAKKWKELHLVKDWNCCDWIRSATRSYSFSPFGYRWRY